MKKKQKNTMWSIIKKQINANNKIRNAVHILKQKGVYDTIDEEYALIQQKKSRQPANIRNLITIIKG